MLRMMQPCAYLPLVMFQRSSGSGRHLLAELPLDCALRCATHQNDPALHRGSEHFGSGRFLVSLHQVNTSWTSEECLTGVTL